MMEEGDVKYKFKLDPADFKKYDEKLVREAVDYFRSRNSHAFANQLEIVADKIKEHVPEMMIRYRARFQDSDTEVE